MTRHLEALGYWFDDVAPNTYPRPQALVGAWDADERQRVVAHLREGVTFETCRGLSWCRFHCGVSQESMGSRDLSDGRWVWPEGLAHYVEAHSVRLPDRFVQHVLTHAGSIEKANAATAVNEEAWLAWAREHKACVDISEPWVVPSISARSDLSNELEKEVGPGHPLWKQAAVAVLRRNDQDDVLFLLSPTRELALVHLTWRGERETDPRWPATQLLSGWEEWIAVRDADE